MRLFVPILAVLVLASCQPRGETRKLDEILSGARSHFNQELNSAGPAAIKDDTRTRLVALGQSLEEAISAGDGRAAAHKKIAEQIEYLTPRSGYTSRASLSELVEQHRSISETAENSAASSKLLVARTYTLLSSEMETTRFGL
ncbi:MAG: hypothetical protein DCC75_11115 [Proteobacteria bacterium]|nr:MAG: hypothetical protein DCC75_11115 [Pseudomonadota bacterium]